MTEIERQRRVHADNGVRSQEARDDEREALARIINDSHLVTRGWAEMRARSGFERTNGDDYSIAQGLAAADALIAAGYRKRPEPEITDEMIRAAREVLDDPHDDWPAEGYWDRMTRAALEAALRLPVREGEQ